MLVYNKDMNYFVIGKVRNLNRIWIKNPTAKQLSYLNVLDYKKKSSHRLKTLTPTHDPHDGMFHFHLMIFAQHNPP